MIFMTRVPMVNMNMSLTYVVSFFTRMRVVPVNTGIYFVFSLMYNYNKYIYIDDSYPIQLGISFHMVPVAIIEKQ